MHILVKTAQSTVKMGAIHPDAKKKPWKKKVNHVLFLFVCFKKNKDVIHYQLK